MPTDSPGVAFIGAGDIAVLHAAAVKKCPGAKLIGLWNRSQDRAKQRAAEFGCKMYATARRSLRERPGHRRGVHAHESGNAPRVHEAGARTGKHVLVEKPVGVSVAEIEEMSRLAKAKRLVCMPGHNYIYEASMQRTPPTCVRQRRPRQDRVRVRHVQHPPPRGGGGALPRRRPADPDPPLVHPAVSRRQAGGLCAMKATLHYQEYTEEDIAMVQMRLENGALAHFCASFAADDHAADPWTVHGEGDRHRGQHALQLPRPRRDQAGARPQPDVHGLPGLDDERGAVLPGRLLAASGRSH